MQTCFRCVGSDFFRLSISAKIYISILLFHCTLCVYHVQHNTGLLSFSILCVNFFKKSLFIPLERKVCEFARGVSMTGCIHRGLPADHTLEESCVLVISIYLAKGKFRLCTCRALFCARLYW